MASENGNGNRSFILNVVGVLVLIGGSIAADRLLIENREATRESEMSHVRDQVRASIQRPEYDEFRAGLKQQLDDMKRSLERIEQKLDRQRGPRNGN